MIVTASATAPISVGGELLAGGAELGAGDGHGQLADEGTERVGAEIEACQAQRIIRERMRDDRDETQHRYRPPAAALGAQQDRAEAGHALEIDEAGIEVARQEKAGDGAHGAAQRCP
jgi:hypothetical protein